jgi:GDPmannose 4,6-dehydratase
VITGYEGQDGSYLNSLLTRSGYDVFGISRAGVVSTASRRHHAVDITEFQDISPFLREVAPDEIYHLAAIQGSSERRDHDDFDLFNESYAVNVLSTLNILETVHRYLREAKMFFASSAQIFGSPLTKPQTELSERNPDNIYGKTKLMATELCSLYRKTRGVFASVGILYNHESPLRKSEYVSKKVARGVASILRGSNEKIAIGSLGAQVDWGYAGDYVEAMNLILQLDAPDEFIVATGETHSVEELVKTCFHGTGLDWHDYVVTDHSLLESEPRTNLVGDSSKLRKTTGWSPKTSFNEMMRIMLDYELKR